MRRNRPIEIAERVDIDPLDPLDHITGANARRLCRSAVLHAGDDESRARRELLLIIPDLARSRTLCLEGQAGQYVLLGRAGEMNRQHGNSADEQEDDGYGPCHEWAAPRA